jgi:hypothetical protein
MAKRGYRGKHPNDDMKVAPTSTKAANYDKLTKEYGKIGIKQKYDYIKSHDGFYPVGSCDVVCHGDNDDGQDIVIISTDGTSRTYTGADAGTTAASGLFKTDTTDVAAATGLKTCIEHANGHGGKITVSRDSATLTLTQVEPGPDGNTTVDASDLAGTSDSTFTGG